MAQNKKLRLSVPLSAEVYQIIEEESLRLGVSMSAWCAFQLGTMIETKRAMMQSVTGSMNEAIQKSLENEKR